MEYQNIVIVRELMMPPRNMKLLLLLNMAIALKLPNMIMVAPAAVIRIDESTSATWCMAGPTRYPMKKLRAHRYPILVYSCSFVQVTLYIIKAIPIMARKVMKKPLKTV